MELKESRHKKTTETYEKMEKKYIEGIKDFTSPHTFAASNSGTILPFSLLVLGHKALAKERVYRKI